MSDKYLIAGLGNPGRRYAKTRHNVGFHVVDELARRYQLPAFTDERKALTTDGLIQKRRVILAKPQTYMNLSGEAVRALVDYYNIALPHLIVVYDDLDTPFGTLRLRKNGGHGGQNGMRNIIHHLGTKEIARVRFGIGRPPGRMAAKDYVLQGFTADDAQIAQHMVENAADAIETWLAAGIEAAMSQHNGDVNDDDNGQSAGPSLKDQVAVAVRAHELNPKDPRPLQQMAKLYKKMQQTDQAVQAHLALAALYKQSDDPRQMIFEWGQAVKLQPGLVALHEEIAIAYEELGDTRRAVSTWLSLAKYHHKQDDLESALEAVLEALRLNPQHPGAIDLQKQYRQKLTM